MAYHRSACATSGFLASRALPLEHAVARVCREAGAQVARNVRVGDMNIDVPVSGTSHRGSRQRLASVARRPTRDRRNDRQPGHPNRRRAAWRGYPPRSRRAGRSQTQTAPNLRGARRARLVALGIEVGGRFSTEAASFLRLLARHRAASVAAPLWAAARAGWVQRWSGMLGVAAMRAHAASLLELPPAGEACVAGEAPELYEILADVRGRLPPDDQPLAGANLTR